jgi:hypothetical protein
MRRWRFPPEPRSHEWLVYGRPGQRSAERNLGMAVALSQHAKVPLDFHFPVTAAESPVKAATPPRQS